MVLSLIHEPRISIRMALLTKQIGMRRDEFTSTTLCQLRKLTKFIVSCKNQTNKQKLNISPLVTLSYRTVVALTSCYGIGQHRRPRRAGQKKKTLSRSEKGGSYGRPFVSKYIGAVFCHVYT